jgi:hypothetical protein
MKEEIEAKEESPIIEGIAARWIAEKVLEIKKMNNAFG